MKRQNLFLFLSFIFTFTFSNFVNGKSLNKEYIKVDKKARKLKNKILRTKSNYSVNGVVYYVSADGDDSNSGTNQHQPFKSLNKINSLNLQRGDVVLFRRGDMWRGCIHTKAGVTYSAYGKGDKPILNGSPFNAVEHGAWLETNVPNVYAYSEPIDLDVAVLVLNEGEHTAFKVMKRKSVDNSTTLHIDLDEQFTSFADLRRDLDFWHEPANGIVYLCSHQGNPSKRFKSIEMPIRRHGFYATDDVIIDNFCIKYVGSHGIGSGTTQSLVVRNCELGWIGGSIQFYGDRQPTRYGNGIEIYGGCGRYVIDHCYVYQCYDAGITHQISAVGNEEVLMQDVTYSNNLIEDCVYAIEYFVGKAENGANRRMQNVLFTGNILRRAGYGFGNQRPDKTTPALIKSWGHYNKASNFRIVGNVFDRSKPHSLHISADDPEWLPKLQNNTHILLKGTDALLGSPEKTYPVDENYGNLIRRLFDEEGGRYILVEEDDVP